MQKYGIYFIYANNSDTKSVNYRKKRAKRQLYYVKNRELVGKSIKQFLTDKVASFTIALVKHYQ